MDREAAIDLVNRYALEVQKYTDCELDDDGSTMTDLFNEIVDSLAALAPAREGVPKGFGKYMVGVKSEIVPCIKEECLKFNACPYDDPRMIKNHEGHYFCLPEELDDELKYAVFTKLTEEGR